MDFLLITLSLDWNAEMRWDKNHGIEDLILLSKIHVTIILTMDYILIFFYVIGAFLLTHAVL